MNLGLVETRSATLKARMRGIWQRSAVELAYVTALRNLASKEARPSSTGSLDRGHLLRTTLATRHRPLVAEP